MSDQKKPFANLPPVSRDEAKDLARPMLKWYLEEKLHINTRSGQNFRCLDPEHADTNPSMSYDTKRHKAHCFTCEHDWDIFDCVAAVEELEDPSAAFDIVYDMLGLTVTNRPTVSPADLAHITLDIMPDEDEEEPAATTHDYSDYLNSCRVGLLEHQPALDYLIKRGLTIDAISRFGLGFDKDTSSITIPYNAERTYYISRGIDGAAVQHRKPKADEAGPEPVFNTAALYGNSAVYVVESPLCAISIEQEDAAAVAIGGTGRDKLLRQLRQRPTSATLILALDNDIPGQKNQTELAESLRSAKIAFVEHDAAAGHKDPNDALQRDPDAFRAAVAAGKERAIQTAADEALSLYRQKYSAAKHVPGFLERIKQSVDTPATSTGFDKLDDVLDGGLHEGLYILGAISSLGKTTYALQIADQIAASGRDVLIISLEMSRDELMAKSISRHTLIECQKSGYPSLTAKTTRGIMTGRFYPGYNEQEHQVIEAATTSYTEYATNLFIVEGAGNIDAKKVRELVEQHVAHTGKAPVLLIDYLQIMAPHDIRATDKQNTDHAVTELKRISRDHHIPVLAVSSFNRENYTTPVNMAAFKESGAIEYSSDVLLGLQLKGAGVKGFDVNEAKTRDPRWVECHVIKNRNGRTGMIDLSYYPKFNFFEEPRPTIVTRDDLPRLPLA